MVQTNKDLSFNSKDLRLLFSNLSEENDNDDELSDIKDEEKDSVVMELNKYCISLVGCSSKDNKDKESESENESEDKGNDEEKPLPNGREQAQGTKRRTTAMPMTRVPRMSAMAQA